jgi:hypothetical protein
MGLFGDGQALLWAAADTERVLTSSKSKIFLSILGVSNRIFVI